MGYKCSFLDNQVYTAQEVNEVFSALTSGGVVYTDTGNTLTDFNDSFGNTITHGICGDINSCKVILSDGIYKITTGTCFMADGSSITIDNEGHIIDIPVGEEIYVCFNRNVVSNSIDIVLSETEPEGETYILLAKINADGTVTDRRSFAHAKVMVSAPQTLRNFTMVFSDCDFDTSETKSIDIPDSNFSYIIMWDSTVASQGAGYSRVATGRNLIPFIEGEFVSMPIGVVENAYNGCVYLKKEGSRITIYVEDTAPGEVYTLNFSVV